MDPTPLPVDIEDLRLAATSGLLVLSVFCGHLLLLQDRHRHIRLPLALFFWANALELLALPVFYLNPSDELGIVNLALELAEVPLTMVQPFLLWLYVYRLTDDPGEDVARPRWIWHALPVGFACLVYLYVLFLPADVQAGLQPGMGVLDPLQNLALIGLYGATLMFYGLVPVYAVLVLRRLRRYRSRLKDLFASTEGRELAWAWWLTAAVSVFWIFNALAIIASVFGLTFPGVEIFDSLLAAILVRYVLTWSVALWAARQQPGLEPPTAKTPVIVDEVQPMRKYGKSGLSDIRLDRIAAKIEALMADERLYLEPDLSLWDLAGRIGVTTHYASQALNDKIGERFFDYVNRWRIRDASDRLRTTDATILAIAYDVGFNSRSSFYTAFKRELGMTPSQYRREA